MKSHGKKLGNPGKVGSVATGKKNPPGKVTSNQSLDRDKIGSAMGLLNKHFMGVK